RTLTSEILLPGLTAGAPRLKNTVSPTPANHLRALPKPTPANHLRALPKPTPANHLRALLPHLIKTTGKRSRFDGCGNYCGNFAVNMPGLSGIVYRYSSCSEFSHSALHDEARRYKAVAVSPEIVWRFLFWGTRGPPVLGVAPRLRC